MAKKRAVYVENPAIAAGVKSVLKQLGISGVKTKRVKRNPGMLGELQEKVRRNVAAGFVDSQGIFHPLRASYDYDPIRVGEKDSGRGRGRKKAKPRKKAKKAKRRNSPARAKTGQFKKRR